MSLGSQDASGGEMAVGCLGTILFSLAFLLLATLAALLA